MNKSQMSWTKTILYSCALSFAYLIYIGIFIDHDLTLWVIREIGATLKSVNAQFGHPYARILGHAVAYLISLTATLIFLLPLGLLIKPILRLAVSTLIVVTPSFLIELSGTEASIFGVAAITSTVVGAVITIGVFQSLTHHSSGTPNGAP